MIIRAASDSESDDDLLSAAQASTAPRRSVFDPPGSVNDSANGSGARYAWFVVCGALILLLLVDLAALFDPSVDTFALLPLLLPTIFYQETVILPPTASMLNQIVGMALVGVWVYCREKSLASGGSTQWLKSARYGLWTVGSLLCLGHVVSCLYVLFALLESNGDRSKFWLGKKHHKSASTSPFGRV